MSQEAEDEELRRNLGEIAEILAGLPRDLRLRLADEIVVQTEAAKAAYGAAEDESEECGGAA